MHETLRSTFKLTKKNQEWQQITSDFMYGTFFSIYAKFIYDKNSFSPKYYDVKIQNYQGNVSIGIEYINPEIKVIYDKIVDEYVYLFTIKLKALSINNQKSNNPEYKSEKNNIFDNNDIITLSEPKNGYLHNQNTTSINEFTKDNLMHVNLEYENIHEGNDFLSIEPNKLPFIDGARYVRDGDQLRELHYKSQDDDQSIWCACDQLIQTELLVPVNHSNAIEAEYVKSRPCRCIYVRFTDHIND